MNVKQAKILLEKINRLFHSMTMDDHISEIEKELMRNYVKSLYEEFLPARGTSASPIVEAPKVVKEVPKPKPAPARVAPVVETPPPPPPPKVEAVPIPVSPPPPVPKPKPVVVEPPKVIKKVVPSPPPPPPVRASAPKSKKSSMSEEMEDLFEFKKATDLSERLSESPIKDLRKAMGINERILTTNELFDGNGDALKDALSTINNLNSFDEAQDYLINIGEIYDWTTKKKKKKAKVFIKLVRRRFL